jgi:hypothetical protein
MTEPSALEQVVSLFDGRLYGGLKDRAFAELAERAAQGEQLKQVTALTTHANQVLTDVDLAVRDTEDDNRTLRALLVQATEAVEQASTDTHKLMVNASAVVDPAPIQASMANVVQSTEHINQATADVAATMQDVRAGVHHELQVLFAPVNKVKWAAEETVSLLGRFFGFH